MNKKILAVILTLAMVTALFSGCGKKDSSYFKELKSVSSVTTGTGITEIALTYSDSEEVPYEILKNKDGKIAVSLKIENTCESNKKAGAKVSVKLGQEENYSELTTIVVDDKTLYITVDSIIDVIKKVDSSMAENVQSTLSQMGISGAVSLNLEQFMQAAGSEMPDTSKCQKEAYKLLENFINSLEKNFKALEGQDGDDYTLTVNGDNADKVVDGVVSFLKNDASGLLDDYTTLVESMYGNDNEMVSSMNDQIKDIKSNLGDYAKSAEDNKDDAVKSMKDYNVNIVSKAQINGKEGSRTGKVSCDAKDIKIDEENSLTININCEVKESKPEIKDMIPDNASDVTTMLITIMNQYGLSGTDKSDTSLY